MVYSKKLNGCHGKPFIHYVVNYNMKNYLIAGGSSGIGLQILQQLSDNNNHIVAFGRNIENHQNTQHVAWHRVNILDEVPLFPQISVPLHGLVYCPGTINLKPFRALKPEDFINDIQTNVIGAVKTIKQYLPNMQHQEGASVVLFSTVAVAKGMPFHASVASAKGAIEGLSKSLAAEFAPHIRVNAIAPSLTQTPLAEKLLNTEQKITAAAERHPLKKIGSAADIAQAVIYLLQASWVTGQIIHVDGGMSTIQ